MNCVEIQLLLVGRACGESNESSAVAEHLRRCEACRREAQLLADTWTEASAIPPVCAPRKCLDTVRSKAAALVERRRGSSRFFWRRMALASAAGFAALLAAAALMFTLTITDQEPRVAAVEHAADAPADPFWTKAQCLEADIQEVQFAAQTDESADLFSLTLQQVKRDLQRLAESDF
jgi:anti-sigma factor RsiW